MDNYMYGEVGMTPSSDPYATKAGSITTYDPDHWWVAAQAKAKIPTIEKWERKEIIQSLLPIIGCYDAAGLIDKARAIENYIING